MNDKIQLAAMGEHLAKQQQPMCLQKRVEQLEALLREAVDAGDPDNYFGRDLLSRIESALDGEAIAPPAAPEGWKLVPVKPTHDMLCVVINCGHFDVVQPEMSGKYYRAMLAAAPKFGGDDA